MGVPKTHYFLLDTEVSGGEVGKKFRGLKAPRLTGPVAQAGSRESSNRLRRFLGSKVGQGPLGGSESISVRSRTSLGVYLPRGVEVLLVIRDRMVSGESEGLQERGQAEH